MFGLRSIFGAWGGGHGVPIEDPTQGAMMGPQATVEGMKFADVSEKTEMDWRRGGRGKRGRQI